jgi:membrane protein DedA with SNARE-associated domain
VIAVAALAGFAGDQAFFWLGRRRGAALIARWPSLERQSVRVHRLIERWHEALIIGVRFAYGLRIAGPVLIGTSAVSAWRFALFNALGALLWAVSVAAVGWFVGAAAEALLGELHDIEGWLLLGLLLVLALSALVRRWRT